MQFDKRGSFLIKITVKLHAIIFNPLEFRYFYSFNKLSIKFVCSQFINILIQKMDATYFI